MDSTKLFLKLKTKEISVTLDNILDNSKASSGGQRHVDFLKYLIDSNMLALKEAVFKRTLIGFSQRFYKETYKKMNYESDRHFMCRASLQDELLKLGINTMAGVDVGNMNILRSNCSYDIVSSDYSILIDIGLTPARSYFKGLTDLRVKHYLVSAYFDDYMDDIVFADFSRTNDESFLNAVKDYQESFKEYIPAVARSETFSEYVE